MGPERATVREGATRDEVAHGLIAELPVLRRYARHLCRDPDRSAELVQSVVLRALEKAHLWMPGTDLRGWLITMTRNLFLSGERTRKRDRAAPIEEVADRLGVAPPQERWIELTSLVEALRRLRPSQRDLLLQVGLQHETYVDAARRLRIPLGTVRSRLWRARSQLRSQMDAAA